jgi:hypothetical protein
VGDKNIKIIIVLSITSWMTPIYSQMVFQTVHRSQADFILFETRWLSDADLIIYKTESRREAKGEKGVWYFTKFRGEATVKVFFTKYRSEADFTIHFTKWRGLTRGDPAFYEQLK